MRRVLSFLLLALAGPGAAVAIPASAATVPDTGTLALTADSEGRWIAYTLTPGNQLRFDAELDGRPLSAVLDTGASVSTLSRAYADRTERHVTARGEAAAIGGRVAIGWTATALLRFGGLTRAGGGLTVAALPAGVTGHDRPLDLLVGRDLLERFAIEIDPDARRFRLLPSGRMPFVGQRAPLTVGRAPASFVSELVIAGRRIRPVIVDTGDGTGVTLSRAVWRTLPLAPAPAATTLLAQGVGGPVEAEVAHLPAVTLGATVMPDVDVWVEPTGGFSDTAGAAGRIGMGLLGRYRLLLDPTAGHLILAPPASPAPAPVRSTSGLQLALDGDRLRVLHVMRGSPAALAGWRSGETICAVDGARVAADPAGAARADWPVGPPGTIVTLDLCDGARRRLTLARFF